MQDNGLLGMGSDSFGVLGHQGEELFKKETNHGEDDGER